MLGLPSQALTVMTIQVLHTDEALRLREFPVAREKIFLAHAGVCPLPARVSQAIQHYSELCTQGDQETLLPAMQMSQTRELAGRLVGASAQEIAFVGPTSLALSFVAAGLEFQPGQNVVAYLDDYPANVYPWMALAERGVELRLVKPEKLGRIELQDVMKQVNEKTRLVALASCHFVSGYRIDLSGIGEMLRDRNILFCVDAIQTLGAFPMDCAAVDFLAADAHKWLLGPCGAGILYVRKAVQEQLRPVALGWHNVRCPDFVAQESIVFRPDARKYEAGTHNLLGMAGLCAGLELLMQIGISNIAAELLRKRSWIVPLLRSRGYFVLGDDAPPERAGGIITFYRQGHDMAALHARLESANVIASLRTDRSGQRHIRFSPHFYNTDAEVLRAVELL
jgi:cysteine desulfurase / selenocysteine lyase